MTMKLAARAIGAGPPLVLLHGLFGHAGNFGMVSRALSTTHRVIALDLRNHGSSPHAASMTYPEMADDVRSTLEEIGAWPAVLVGHSMGGKVAMALALSAPEMPRLCVVDIAPRAYASGFGKYVAAMQAVPLAAGLTRAEADAVLAPAEPNPGVRSFLLQNLRLDSNPPAWRLNLGAVGAGLADISAWKLDGIYPGPTLFLAGERSDYIRPADQGAIQAQFPKARIATIPGAGHWVHAEAPDAFLAAIQGFLATRP